MVGPILGDAFFDGSKVVPVDVKPMRGRRRMPVPLVTAARDPNFGGFFTRLLGVVWLRQGWGAYAHQVVLLRHIV